MLWILAQAAPVASSVATPAGIAGTQVEWGHLLALSIPVLLYLAQVIVARVLGVGQKGRLASLLVEVMTEASEEHAHGTPWAGSVLDRAEKHSAELLQLAQDVIPQRLQSGVPNPPGAGGSSPTNSPPPAPGASS